MYRWGLGATPPPTIATALQNASATYNVPLPILQATAAAESSYNPNAVSPAGAQGLMQIMPATGASLGLTNPFDPVQSANAGAQYLSQLYQKYGDWKTALEAYNEGPGNLATQGVFPSSQSYAEGILAQAGYSDSAPAPASLPADTPISPSGSISDSYSMADTSAGEYGTGFDPNSIDLSTGGGFSSTALLGVGLVAGLLIWALA